MQSGYIYEQNWGFEFFLRKFCNISTPEELKLDPPAVPGILAWGNSGVLLYSSLKIWLVGLLHKEKYFNLIIHMIQLLFYSFILKNLGCVASKCSFPF